MPTPKRKFSLKDIIRKSQNQNIRNAQRVLDEIMALMDKGASKAANLVNRRQLINNRFLPKDVRDAIDRIVTTFHADASQVIINGITRARKLADEKTNVISEGYMGGGQKPPTKATEISSSGGRRRRPPSAPKNPIASNFGKHFNPRSLSPRVWKLANSYKSTINKTLVDGMKKGIGAKQLAKDLTRNLRNPSGSLSPGTGVYRSPKKNAERLARTETNLAYQFQDFERWQTQWFVTAIEIRLSAQHPKYDICDPLVGEYPKDFLFPGWHPNCLCIAVPVLADEETRDAMLDYNLGLRKYPPEVKYRTIVPGRMILWMKNNSERIKKWKNQPYFIKYNQKHLADLME
ncbi:hypothetical protein [Flavihumibacter petaseus]|uniref:Phage head morphogenesis domain-containing protein n=1 Tax=Flavihumibacter petaseus NBRC 106054 TaxID=1220578 RepID=A0A0E9N1Y3_9BACT|nr:hypothetical protein [Flavihumibacter petaseus]GAO43788.1 hypothetical protein FPE01S_02_08940 [Flavihumibacter petaseus NBRC 106054]